MSDTMDPNTRIVTRTGKNDVVLSRRTLKLYRYSCGGFRLVCNDGFILFYSILQESRPKYQHESDLVKKDLAKAIINYISIGSDTSPGEPGRFLMPIHSNERAVELGLPLESRGTAFMVIQDPLEKIHHFLRAAPRRHRGSKNKVDFSMIALDRMRKRIGEFLLQTGTPATWSVAAAFCLGTSDIVGPTVVFELLTSAPVIEVLVQPPVVSHDLGNVGSPMLVS